MKDLIFGTDVGGVILDKANDGTDTSFLGGNHLKTTAMPGAIETLRTIRDHVADRARRQAEAKAVPYDEAHPPIYVVSKCGENVQRKTREWMRHHDFYARTGIPEDHVRFCLERKDKAPICRDLGITHFVDDKLEVLSYLESVPKRYLFCPSEREVGRYKRHLALVEPTGSWSDLLRKFLDSDKDA